MSFAEARKAAPFLALLIDAGFAPFSTVTTARAVAVGIDKESRHPPAVAQAFYPRLARSFLGNSRKIKNIYWPTCFKGGIALLENNHEPRRKLWPFKRTPELVLECVCNAMEPPEIWRLSKELDDLLITTRRFLTGEPRNMAIELIYSTYTHLFLHMEQRAAQGDSHTLKEEHLRQAQDEVKWIEEYVRDEARLKSQRLYLLGMIPGLLMVLGIAVAGFVARQSISGLDGTWLAGTWIAGGAGAVLSVMMRTTRGAPYVNPEPGRWRALALGAFRPFIGAFSAAVVYLFLSTGIVALKVSAQPAGPFYWAAGLVAGFSERWVRDMLTTAPRLFGHHQAGSQ